MKIIGIGFIITAIALGRMDYALIIINSRVATLEAHQDILAKMVQQEQYQLDIITEYIKNANATQR